MRQAPWLVLAVLVPTALAAVAVTYQATTMTATVAPPPVTFTVGAGGSNTRYFAPPLEQSPNATSLSGTLKGKAGADATVKDVARLVEAAGASQLVTLAATQVTNSRVETLTWTVKSGATTIAILNSRAPDPSTTFTLPANATYALDLRVDLADGAGKNNSPTSFDLWLVVD